ncbi:MAG: hypothetical protein R3Y50_07260 [Rikenellaceae bacterium]
MRKISIIAASVLLFCSACSTSENLAVKVIDTPNTILKVSSVK